MLLIKEHDITSNIEESFIMIVPGRMSSPTAVSTVMRELYNAFICPTIRRQYIVMLYFTKII